MKAITVLQPWACLLATGKKRCETRSWKTNYRGEILIHAGKQNLTLCMKHETIFEARHMKQAGVFDIELATGAIIGKADLVNCVRIDEAIHRLVREQHIEEAREVLQKHLKPFSWVKDCFAPNNMSTEGFNKILEEMSIQAEQCEQTAT